MQAGKREVRRGSTDRQPLVRGGAADREARRTQRLLEVVDTQQHASLLSEQREHERRTRGGHGSEREPAGESHNGSRREPIE